MSNFKDNFISAHGKDAYEKILAQNRAYYKTHKEQVTANHKKYYKEHLEEVTAVKREQCRKGGRHYAKALACSQIGIPGEKRRIRVKHTQQYKPYKDIIASDSQLHHNWCNNGTADYTGLALVEKDQHRHGIIDVIKILEGEISVFTEEELRNIGEDL